jgi:pimeloyl-ACP methyl ester carboxylesterase
MTYVDTRGSNRSDRPELNAYAMRNCVEDFGELKRYLGIETWWLMGHSIGSRMIIN